MGISGDYYKKEIERSFSLFRDDIHSCVNKLRLAVELLMDAHKIHKTAISRKPGKLRSRLTLHKRIELFKKKNQKVGEILEAIKWIGNKGSHADKQLLVNETMDAYELLEHVNYWNMPCMNYTNLNPTYSTTWPGRSIKRKRFAMPLDVDLKAVFSIPILSSPF